jgi:membrane-bound serine protease (ClpP class)
VLPGFGVAGVTGLLLIGAGLVMASQDFLIPQTPRQLESLSVSMLVLASSGVVFLVAASVLSHYFGVLPIFNRLVLKPAPASSTHDEVILDARGKPLPMVQALVVVGKRGITVTALRPAGKARFGDEVLDVLTDGNFVQAGRAVRVDDVQGARIQVSEIEDA